MVDYAFPTMMAEKCLKELHNAFLEQDLETADKKAVEAQTWLIEARWALKLEREKRAAS